jgi:hypothetical protein
MSSKVCYAGRAFLFVDPARVQPPAQISCAHVFVEWSNFPLTTRIVDLDNHTSVEVITSNFNSLPRLHSHYVRSLIGAIGQTWDMRPESGDA